MSQKNDAVKNIVAGSVAGIAEAIVTWPSENIKTQMQFKGNRLNMKNTAFEIYKKDGFLGFYRGLTPVLFFNIPKVASRFYAYNIFSKHLQEKSFNKDAVSILSGLFAGFVESTLITVPSETIKTKMIRFPHMKTMDVVRESGIRGLYLGYFPTLYRQSLNQASRFYFFNKYKDYVSSREKMTNAHSFWGGVGAGIFSVIVSSPMDVLKTQMQEESVKQKSSMVQLSKTIYNSYGILGFWRGSLARLTRVAPGQGIMFLTFDYISKIF